MADHISKQFDQELERVRSRVLEMGGLVEAQIIDAVEGLSNGDITLLNKVINTDHKVNALEVALDDDCMHIIVAILEAE